MESDLSVFEFLQNNAHAKMGISQMAAFNARYTVIREISDHEKEAIEDLKQNLNEKEAEYYRKSNSMAIKIANLSRHLNELKIEVQTHYDQFMEDTKDELEQLEEYGVRTTFIPPKKNTTA